jgi:putative holliday junction resolvase
MRALGLDVGQKTIGVAITDEVAIAAHPVCVIARSGTDRDVSAILALIKEHAITDVVVGMPFDLDGKIGHRARRVQDFARTLQTKLEPAMKLHEQDERFSTAEAERILLAADLSREKRKQVIDRQAATVILQTWLQTWQRSNKI